MTLPDFGTHFAQYIKEWIAKNQDAVADHGEYASIEEYIEERGDDLYLEWLEAPADWLDGVAPLQYFDSFSTAQELMECVRWYYKKGIEVPDPLYKAIREHEEEIAPLLHRLMMDHTEAEALRIFALGGLIEFGTKVPWESYLQIMEEHTIENQLSLMAMEELCYAGEEVWPWVLERYEKAGFSARMGLIHVLSGPPAHPQALAYALDLLKEATRQWDRSILAQVLGRIGDPAAIPTLMETAKLPNLTYLEYIDIRNAVEALDGPPLPEREFSGDPVHEQLRKEPEDV